MAPTKKLDEWPQRRVSADPASEAWRRFYGVLRGIKDFWPTVAADCDLPLAQLKVLVELGYMAPVPMHVVAECMACDASNVTGLVDRMESRGLLERRLDEHDRRIKLIALTKAGHDLRARILARLEAPPPCFEALTVAEQRAIASALAPLADALNSTETR
jgi:DNA-binding MarR family transcriptional regulator